MFVRKTNICIGNW